MTDRLADYLKAELGFDTKANERPGLRQALDVFLGQHLGQRTYIQEEAIEPIYDGASVLLISATASGKTEAAVVPISARLISDADSSSAALYIAPTRALLNDLFKRLESPLGQLGIMAKVRHGDYGLPQNTGAIRFLFTTPESLDVLLSGNHELLSRAKCVVVDEVHQIYGNSRGDQLLFCLRRLQHRLAAVPQIIALSATVGDPEAVGAWLNPSRPVRVITDKTKRKIESDYQWQADSKLYRRILRSSGHDKVLIFANSRRRCDDIYLTLRETNPYETYVHYSTLPREDREYVERGFKASDFAVCVATSTLELGIDIGSIKGIVLADPPGTVSGFLQRIGRGGRREQTNSVTVTPRTVLELLQFIALISLGEKGHVEINQSGHPYSVLVQQIFSIIAGKRRRLLHPAELSETFSTWQWLNTAAVTTILEKLVEKGYLKREPSHETYEIGPQLEELLDRRKIYSNIGDESGGVNLIHSGRIVATVPLLRDQIQYGNVILFAGRFWRIIGISAEGVRVEVTGAVPHPVRPRWGPANVSMASSLVAQEIQRVLQRRPAISHPMDAESRDALLELYQRITAPQSENAIWHEEHKGMQVYYTFAGAMENRLLQLLLAGKGMPCSLPPRAEGIALQSSGELSFDALKASQEEITAYVSGRWQELAPFVNKGPFFDLLPAKLKQDEILSSIPISRLASFVASLSSRSVVSLDLHILP